VPNDEKIDKSMHSYYLDEGNQRMISIIIIAKALFSVSENYKLENDNLSVLSPANDVMLSYFVENAKHNFIPENQLEVYSYLMNTSECVLKKYANTKMIKAYNAAVEEYKSVLENSIEEFNVITEFIVNELGCNTTYYRPTSLKVRQQKYNSLNTSIKEQSKLSYCFAYS
jgi:hypothetical protein